MKARSKKLTAIALSYTLAFSPLAPVNYAIAEEQADQRGAIELVGGDTGGSPTQQEGEAAPDTGSQVVVLGEGATRAHEEQGEEGQKEEQSVVLDNEDEGAAKAGDEDAAKVGDEADAKAQADSTDQAKGLLWSQGTGVNYYDPGTDATQSFASATDVTSETTTMEQPDSEPAAYVVRESCTISERVTVKGDVSLVICNDQTLTCPKGITVAKNGHLKIYRQRVNNGAKKAGTLNCETSGSSNADKVAAISVNEGSALTTEGCYINATCKTNDGAGIGGDNGENGGTITINGGVITATSKMNGAGIGGGKCKSNGLKGAGGTITINGGTVTATSGDEDGAGIGGGQGGASGKITINGGEVIAKGSSHGAGIGGGDASASGQPDIITITGGTIDAEGGAYAAGIGGGGDSGYNEISISGGTVTAKGGTESAGIGSANKGNVKKIEISGGDVIAIGASKAAGIGGGDGNDSEGGQYGSIAISGASTQVKAFGGDEAAGIGTGNEPKKNEGTINISGGANVTAVGAVKSVTINDDRSVIYDDFNPEDQKPTKTGDGDYGAGIGGGDCASGGTINISGAIVNAYGSNRAAGIGGGDDAGGNASGKITIDGRAVVNAGGGERAAAIGGGDEGGFDTIDIKGDSVVIAEGGKYGAGIGSGDCSDNATKDAWQEGTISITGANTTVVATGGEDGAGIGGGDESSGCSIKITNLGKPAGGQGSVLAIGLVAGAGIGGGCSPRANAHSYDKHSFKRIDIDKASITAVSFTGAGIGCGGTQMLKYPQSHNEGGSINITDSETVALSMLAGAGIGGGNWAYAKNITISGGFTAANGGALKTGTKSTLGWTLLRDYEDGDVVEGVPPLIWQALQMVVNPPTSGSGWEQFKSIVSAIWHLYINGDWAFFAFQGAGIGGGFASPGGNITIKNNAKVLAAAGKLKSGQGGKVQAKAIGAGGYFGTVWGGQQDYVPILYLHHCDPDSYTVEDDFFTKVEIYDGASVTTAKMTVKDLGGEKADGSPNYQASMSDAATTLSNDTTADPQANILVMSRDVALIEPVPTSFTVTYDANGGEGSMAPQSVENPDKTLTVPVQLSECAFTRNGYSFVGWNEKKDGTGASYTDTADLGVDTTLYAQWKGDDVRVHFFVPEDDGAGNVIKDANGNPQYKSYCTNTVERGQNTWTPEGDFIGTLELIDWIEGTSEGLSDSGERFEKGQKITATKDDMYLYANVKETDGAQTYYTYTYKSFDSNLSPVRVVNVRGGQPYPFPDGEMFGRDGEALEQWNVKDSDQAFKPGDKATPTENLTLVGEWRPVRYTVSFDSNANDATAAEGVLKDQTVEWDSPDFYSSGPGYGHDDSKAVVTLPDAVERQGFNLAGWNTVQTPTEENPGTLYLPGDRVKNLTDTDGDTIILYAQWEKSHESEEAKTVTFVKNAPDGSDGDSYEQPFEPGQTFNLDPNTFECVNATFTGWKDDDGNTYADGAEVTRDEDLTLYAQWQEGKWAKFGYSITLNDSIDIDYNVKALQDDPANFTIEYGFSGEEPTVETLTDRTKNTFTIASCAAKQMSDTVDVTVRHKDADGNETVIKQAQYSIKGYCKDIISKEGKVFASFTDDQANKLNELCQATLDYGSYVQKYLGWRTNELANDGSDYFDNAAINVPVIDSSKSGSCEGIDGENGVSVSLVATSRTQLVVLFKHDAGADKADYDFAVDGHAIASEDVIDRNGKFEIWIDGISAQALGSEHIVTVSKDGQTFGYAATPTCCMSKAVNGEKPVNPELFKSFYNYYKKANAYMGYGNED